MNAFYRLCFELHKTPDELRTMKSADLVYLLAWARREGLPSQRLECVTAQAGAYVGAVWGGKAKPADLLPSFQERKPNLTWKEAQPHIRAWVAACNKGRGKTTTKGANGG